MSTPRDNTRKKSIWAGPPIERYCARRQITNLSGALNTAIERYEVMLESALPTLYWQQWAVIFRALKAGHISPDLLWARVAGAEAPDEAWGFNLEALSAMLRDLPLHQLIAILDAAERLWAGDVPPDIGDWQFTIQRLMGQHALS